MGGALRKYRENLGCTLDDAARILECDRSKISRIETGQRGIRGKELRDLLAEYGVSEDQWAMLAAMADPRGKVVEAVLARQKAILGERRPDIHLVIGEAALHQQVGGLEGSADLAAYGRVFGQLRAHALSPAQSALLLRGMASD